MTRFTLRDLESVATLLRDAAIAEILPRFRRLTVSDVRQKTGPLDIVTEADEAAERLIEARLREMFPAAAVIGEEAASADPTLLRRLPDADLAFVIDPIDGTSNYAAGLPLFGVMAAILIRGETIGAIIHDPMGDDTALALRGEGAWLAAPDGRRTDLKVAPPAPVAELTGAASWRYLPEPLRSTVCRNLPKLASVWDYRCAAHHYRLIAAAHGHFVFFHRLLPWDHAPGVLLHQEAGGYSARFDATPYEPAHATGGLICAPDKATWHALRDALFEA